MSKYDFGSREANLAEYGQEEPPEYEVSRIKLNSPISIYHGAQDSTVTPGDVKRLIADLKSKFMFGFSLEAPLPRHVSVTQELTFNALC